MIESVIIYLLRKWQLSGNCKFMVMGMKGILKTGRSKRLKKNLQSRDRRKTDRLPMPIKIACKLGPKKLIGRAKDSSGGGIRFFLQERLEEGAILELEIELPDEGEPLSATGEVIWCEKKAEQLKGKERERSFEVGIRFIKMSKADRERYVPYFCDRLLVKFVAEDGRIKLD